jgi:hypothetical protein
VDIGRQKDGNHEERRILLEFIEALAISYQSSSRNQYTLGYPHTVQHKLGPRDGARAAQEGVTDIC